MTHLCRESATDHDALRGPLVVVLVVALAPHLLLLQLLLLLAGDPQPQRAGDGAGQSIHFHTSGWTRGFVSKFCFPCIWTEPGYEIAQGYVS